MKMVPCTEESPSSSDTNSEAATITPAEDSTEEAPLHEKKQMTPDSRVVTSQTDSERVNSSATDRKMSEGSNRSSTLVQSAQEGKNTSKASERAFSPSHKWALSFPVVQRGSAPSGKVEKASEDGYNWRKYGQKNVKGNEFIRSYYRCTHPNCLVKKQVERSLEGHITDTVYFGQHDHPKPHVNVPLAIGFAVSIIEEKPEKPSSTFMEEKPSEVRGRSHSQVNTTETPLSPVVAASNDIKSTELLSPRSRSRDDVDNDDEPNSKRKKKENRGTDAASADKATNEARLTIQTTSEVDIVNDGYRWRKYGQKLVKGNPNPRSYYRCSSPGCPVKKHVERASHDAKVVMTTYEGQHDHDMPASRTVTRNPAGTECATISQNDEARNKSEEAEPVSTDAAESSDHKPTEHQIDESENKCDVAKSSASEGEIRPKVQEKDETQDRLSEGQRKSQLTAKPEENEVVCLNKVGKKSKEKQQVLNTAAAVQS